jgi:hypothetical protein
MRPSLNWPEFCQVVGAFLLFLCLPCLRFVGFAPFCEVVFGVWVAVVRMLFYLEVFTFLGVWRSV